ncbi:acyl-CoA dehydrogenase family protein, partial [Streptomyces umbrinus]
MGFAPAPSGPAPESDRTATGRAHWLRVARETADDLATDAVVREQAGKVPFDEVSRLREAGLLTLLIPAELGGAGADVLGTAMGQYADSVPSL